MPLLSLIPLSTKILKDCFKSTIEYTFISVAATGPNPPNHKKSKRKSKFYTKSSALKYSSSGKQPLKNCPKTNIGTLSASSPTPISF
jgi:hypothetical protein